MNEIQVIAKRLYFLDSTISLLVFYWIHARPVVYIYYKPDSRLHKTLVAKNFRLKEYTLPKTLFV